MGSKEARCGARLTGDDGETADVGDTGSTLGRLRSEPPCRRPGSAALR